MVQATIATVGSLNMDLAIQVDRLPGAGETVLGGPYRTFAGGKGANQAVAVALAGGDSRMQGAVGSDAFGQQLIAAVTAAGVDTQGVIRLEGPSGLATIAVETPLAKTATSSTEDRSTGENAIVVSPGANAQFLPDLLDLPAIQAADLLLVQLEIPFTVVTAAIAAAVAAAVPIILNPAPVQPLPEALLQQVDYLVVNETEAARLTETVRVDERSVALIDSPRSALLAARQLRDRGVAAAIVTLGQQGVVWSAATSEAWLPALPVTAIDTTAAGDGFCGALAVALAERWPLADAIAFANGAGAIAVTSLGAQPSLGTRADIQAILRAYPQTPRDWAEGAWSLG